MCSERDSGRVRRMLSQPFTTRPNHRPTTWSYRSWVTNPGLPILGYQSGVTDPGLPIRVTLPGLPVPGAGAPKAESRRAHQAPSSPFWPHIRTLQASTCPKAPATYQLCTHRADRPCSTRTLRTHRDTSPVPKIDRLFFLSSTRSMRSGTTMPTMCSQSATSAPSRAGTAAHGTASPPAPRRSSTESAARRSNDIVVVGLSGTTAHFDGWRWSRRATGTTADMPGVAPLDGTRYEWLATAPPTRWETAARYANACRDPPN